MQQSHGGDIYRNKITYDFSVNINPLGMPEECKQALIQNVSCCENYPDVNAEQLVEKLAEKKNLNKNQIIFGNGAAELIYAFAQSLNIKQAVAIAPTFSEYEKAVLAVGGRLEYVSTEQELLTAVTEEMDAVFLCNPNNPTGKLYEENFLNKLRQQCVKTHTYLFVDECFLPFVDGEEDVTMLSHIACCHMENVASVDITLKEYFKYLIVLRAFTKIYAMPGLRLGYAVVGDEELKSKMRWNLQPWNTSSLAQLAGTVALDLDDYITKTKEMIRQEKTYLFRELQTFSNKGILGVYETEANFILLYSEIDLYEKLLEQGILIRDCFNFYGLEKGYYRIAIRSHEENVALIKAINQVCS